jgi:hypothetical protein
MLAERVRLQTSTLVVGVILAVFLTACHAPITIITPQGKIAYTANEVLKRVQELQRATISAEATGGLPTPAARVLVTFCVETAKVVGALPDGWGATVAVMWGDAKKQLPLRYLENPAILSAVSAVDVALAIFLPSGGVQ